ncbi:MAG TPA: hypothetical protein VHE53_05445 [Patescibacteria group bacterium]|nr:hypothetical protein [Patescibacteria group bacterium]
MNHRPVDGPAMRQMRRYKNLTKDEIYEAFNKIRDAFLAARSGKEVDEIIDAILTSEEKLKVGRRVLVANYLKSRAFTLDEIRIILKVGKSTIQSVNRRREMHPIGFELIDKRSKKVEQNYQKKKYKTVGGSNLIFKQRKYAGIKRKDIER